MDNNNTQPVEPGQKALPIKGKRIGRWLIVLVLASMALLTLMVINRPILESAFSTDEPANPGTWRFIVSGDSRNCGDVVVPTIAAHSLARYQPAFYWHLGDLRAIYKIDEDMAAEAQKKGEYLSCKSYLPDAWPDFIKHQIAPFGPTRFYLGIGNHEVIPPKKLDEFSSTFEDWLVTPRRQMAFADKTHEAESKRIGDSKSEACQRVATQPLAKNLYISPLPYYHWIQGGVEFLYLDNSSGSFYYKEDKSQVDWIDCILDLAEDDTTITTVVVGMHEVLPYSRANDHSMCDHPDNPPEKEKSGCDSGKHVYGRLLKLQEKKKIYVLASHSHFYLEDVFLDPQHPTNPHLPGWIVGTAGAVRYSLPDGIKPSPSAREDTYGYLLATVKHNGEIDFSFKEIKESDIPSEVRQRYPAAFTNWCFEHNSQHKDAVVQETTNRCSPLLPTPTPSPSATPAKSRR